MDFGQHRTWLLTHFLLCHKQNKDPAVSRKMRALALCCCCGGPADGPRLVLLMLAMWFISFVCCWMNAFNCWPSGNDATRFAFVPTAQRARVRPRTRLRLRVVAASAVKWFAAVVWITFEQVPYLGPLVTDEAIRVQYADAAFAFQIYLFFFILCLSAHTCIGNEWQ